MIFLYRRNANSIGTWRIWNTGAIIRIAHATVMGGSEVEHIEIVDAGKQGRTLAEQVASRIQSRVSRMMDRGYKSTIEEAKTSSNKNQLGLYRPMLAHPIARVANPDYRGAVVQKKLNGHRCMITRQDGELIAYSRQGKPIPSIKHILWALEPRISEGMTIDGELYVHGVALQTLASWIKREQNDTSLLNFVAYDLIAKESYKDRHAELSDICFAAESEAKGKVMVLPYESYVDYDSLIVRRNQVIHSGFEGLMVRLDGRGYEEGKRSSSLLKVKKFDDAEYKVVDVVPSAEGWGICVCEIEPGKTFRTSAPGTKKEKEEVLVNKHKYIGKMLTVEYAELTDDGIPFHCSATGWREDV